MTAFQNFKQLFALNKSNRPWHMPVISAVCVGFPVLIGAIVLRPQYGILSGLGGMVFLYMPQTDIANRITKLGLCTLGFCLCFLIGAKSGFNLYVSSVTLCLSSIVISLISRYYLVATPGSLFFILIVAVASTFPFSPSLIPLQVGLIAAGGVFTCLMTFIYSLFTFDNSAPFIPSESNIVIFRAAILEAIIIGVVVGSSFLFAQLIKFENPYWVPISCAAIMQGSTFVEVWQRKIHRVLGTIIGLSLTWGIFSLSPSAIEVAFIIFALNFMVELLVVRNYALAVIFITPLTILFAESTSIGSSTELLIIARLTDIIVGSAFGLVGGWLLRHTK